MITAPMIRLETDENGEPTEKGIKKAFAITVPIKFGSIFFTVLFKCKFSIVSIHMRTIFVSL